MEIGRTFAARVASLSLPAAVFVSLVLVGFGARSSADEAKTDVPNINGVWKLHGRIGDGGEVQKLEGEEARALIVKFISSGRWCVTYADAATGSLLKRLARQEVLDQRNRHIEPLIRAALVIGGRQRYPFGRYEFWQGMKAGSPLSKYRL